MKFRISGKRFTCAVLSACFFSIALMVSPGMASAKEPMIYHGNGFAIRPANMSNWEYNGYQSGMTGGQTVAGLKGESTTHMPDGAMKWTRWDRNRAVGVGGLHTYCGTLSKSKCRKSPWYGTPEVKVVAFAFKSGHYSKMRIIETADPDHFMVLRFIGKHLMPAWKIVREEGS